MTHYYETELEELAGRWFATVEIEYDVSPGEPLIHYRPDGSGDPGAPPELEIIAVQVTSLSGSTWDKTRDELGDFADCVDQLALDNVLGHVDRGGWLMDHLFDNASED